MVPLKSTSCSMPYNELFILCCAHCQCFYEHSIEQQASLILQCFKSSFHVELCNFFEDVLAKSKHQNKKYNFAIKVNEKRVYANFKVIYGQYY